MIITPKDIIGSKIIAVHIKDGEENGYPTCDVYFTVDRGFCFKLPWPGSSWEALKRSEGAVEIVDTNVIKSKKIVNVLCPPMDEELGFYEPDTASLELEDGSQVYCISCAPPGIPLGLFYEPRFIERDKLIDYFSVPTNLNDF